MKKIILASASPRRKELLEKAGLKFEIVESRVDEHLDIKLEPHTFVKKLSLRKAKAVYENNKNAIIIAADTVVFHSGKILGKPKDKKDAKEMLELLSGQRHFVITGFTIIDTSLKKPITKSEETKVFMRKITPEEIEDYILTKEPYDKAGAYAIQGIAGKFIEKIEGDLNSAIGLPIASLLKELEKLNVKI